MSLYLHSKQCHSQIEQGHGEMSIHKDDIKLVLSLSSAQEYKEDWSSRSEALCFHQGEVQQRLHSIKLED